MAPEAKVRRKAGVVVTKGAVENRTIPQQDGCWPRIGQRAIASRARRGCSDVTACYDRRTLVSMSNRSILTPKPGFHNVLESLDLHMVLTRGAFG